MDVKESTEDMVGNKEYPNLSEELKKVVEKVTDEKPLDVIEITDAEKLQSARLELSFLKVQQEIEIKNKIAQNIQRSYPQFVNTLAKKYAIDQTVYVFDAVEANFKRKK